MLKQGNSQTFMQSVEKNYKLRLIKPVSDNQKLGKIVGKQLQIKFNRDSSTNKSKLSRLPSPYNNEDSLKRKLKPIVSKTPLQDLLKINNNQNSGSIH
jgi:hypothetical protein